jgi:hypothetical protein
MRIIDELKNQLKEVHQKVQDAATAAERTRWLNEYQRIYRTLKVQEAIVFG